MPIISFFGRANLAAIERGLKLSKQRAVRCGVFFTCLRHERFDLFTQAA